MNKIGGTHLTRQDRLAIEKYLENNLPCVKIAELLDKDERRISKEIKKEESRKKMVDINLIQIVHQ